MGFSLRPETPVIQLKELLGEGMSSRVFAALRIDSRGFSVQEVVLKLLKPGTDVSGLKREFQALSKIRGPHCVRMFGWENLNEGPALVLEKVDGVTLAEFAAAGDVSAAECDEITAQIQNALAAVHAVGLHHGDLSPGNVLIDADGWIRLIDFAQMEMSCGSFAGTPPYVPVECWDGEVPGAAADLFALGLLRIDLGDGFRSVPNSRSECETRSRRAVDQNSLLSRVPERRRPLPLSSDESQRAGLAERVRSIIAEKTKWANGTAVIDIKTPGARVSSRSWVAAALCALVLSVPTLSGTAVSANGASAQEPSAMELRTARWTEFTLNGKSVGFAPARISNLAAGFYVLEWRDSRGSGRIHLRIPRASTIVITDRDIDASRD